MFLFALIIGYIVLAVIVSSVSKQDNIAIYNRRKAVENGNEYYYTSTGLKVRTDTNKPFVYERKGDSFLEVNPYTGEVYRNITEERNKKCAKEEYAAAVKEGRRLYAVDITPGVRKSDGFMGTRYRDMISGNEYYVYIMPHGGIFLLDPKTEYAYDVLDQGDEVAAYFKPESIRNAVMVNNYHIRNGEKTLYNYRKKIGDSGNSFRWKGTIRCEPIPRKLYVREEFKDVKKFPLLIATAVDGSKCLKFEEVEE